MIEIRKSQLIIATGVLINLGSGLILSIFAVKEAYLKIIILLFGIILLRGAIFLEDKMEQIYD